MRLFDSIFSRKVTPDIPRRNPQVSAEAGAIDGKPVIMSDPEQPISSSSNRPPVIFENGIR